MRRSSVRFTLGGCVVVFILLVVVSLQFVSLYSVLSNKPATTTDPQIDYIPLRQGNGEEEQQQVVTEKPIHYEENLKEKTVHEDEGKEEEDEKPKEEEEEEEAKTIQKLIQPRTQWLSPTRKAKLDNLFNQYKLIYQSILDPNDQSYPKKFIYFDFGGSGLGNQIHTAISCFMMAIVSKRAIRLGSGITIPTLYYSPNLPDLFTYNFPSSTRFSFVGGGDKTDGPGSDFMDTLSCKNLTTAWQEHNNVYIVSNQYLGALLIANPHYRAFWEEYFGPDVFGPLFNYLFSPKEIYQKRALEIKEKYFDGNFVVGLHMRREYIQTVLNQGIFWRCAELLLLNSGFPPEKTKIYIASDEPSFISGAKEQLGSVVIGASDVAPGESHMYLGLDILLVSYADEILATPHSTFSQIIFGSVSKLPWFVNEVNTCNKQPHAHPCYFYLLQTLKEVSCKSEIDDDNNLAHPLLYLNQRNCYTNYHWGLDHI